jgi:hypothetical protein
MGAKMVQGTYRFHKWPQPLFHPLLDFVVDADLAIQANEIGDVADVSIDLLSSFMPVGGNELGFPCTIWGRAICSIVEDPDHVVVGARLAAKRILGTEDS